MPYYRSMISFSIYHWLCQSVHVLSSAVLFSVADPRFGIRYLFDPGYGIRNRFFPDHESQTHIFDSLITNFWVKVLELLVFLPKKILYLFQNKLFTILWYLWLQKIVEQQKLPPSSFGALLDLGLLAIRIRDQHSGSATLVLLCFRLWISECTICLSAGASRVKSPLPAPVAYRTGCMSAAAKRYKVPVIFLISLFV